MSDPTKDALTAGDEARELAGYQEDLLEAERRMKLLRQRINELEATVSQQSRDMLSDNSQYTHLHGCHTAVVAKLRQVERTRDAYLATLNEVVKFASRDDLEHRMFGDELRGILAKRPEGYEDAEGELTAETQELGLYDKEKP